MGCYRTQQPGPAVTAIAMHLLNAIIEDITVSAGAIGPKEGHAEYRVAGGLSMRHDVQDELAGSGRPTRSLEAGGGAVHPCCDDPCLAKDHGRLLLGQGQIRKRNSGSVIDKDCDFRAVLVVSSRRKKMPRNQKQETARQIYLECEPHSPSFRTNTKVVHVSGCLKAQRGTGRRLRCKSNPCKSLACSWSGREK